MRRRDSNFPVGEFGKDNYCLLKDWWLRGFYEGSKPVAGLKQVRKKAPAIKSPFLSYFLFDYFSMPTDIPQREKGTVFCGLSEQ